MLSGVPPPKQEDGPTRIAREARARDAEFRGEVVDDGEGSLRAVGRARAKLVLHEDLVDEDAQRAPVVPHLCDPQVRVDVPLPVETGAERSVGSGDRSVTPVLRHAGSPALEVAVDFKRGRADDLRVCDAAGFEGCSKVDDSERYLTDGSWAGDIAISPRLPDAAALEVACRLHQGRRHGHMLLHAG